MYIYIYVYIYIAIRGLTRLVGAPGQGDPTC